MQLDELVKLNIGETMIRQWALLQENERLNKEVARLAKELADARTPADPPAKPKAKA